MYATMAIKLKKLTTKRNQVGNITEYIALLGEKQVEHAHFGLVH